MSDNVVTRRHAFGLAKRPAHRERVKPRKAVKPLRRQLPPAEPVAPPDMQTIIGHVSTIMTSNRRSLEADLAALARLVGIVNVRSAIGAADTVLSASASTAVSRAATNGITRARSWAATAIAP